MFSIYLEYLDDSDTEKFLFFKNNKDFFADDIFSLKLNMELGQPGTLEALISPKNILNKMDYFKGTIIRVFNNDTEIWRGILSKIETDYYGNKNVLFDGCLSSLKYLISRYPDYLVIPYAKKDAEGYPNPEESYMGRSFKDKDVIDCAFKYILKLDFYSYKKDPENILYNCDERDTFFSNLGRYSKLGEVDYQFDLLNNILNKYLLSKYGGYLIPRFHKEDIKWDVEYLSSSSIKPTYNALEEGYRIIEKKDLISFKKELYEDSVVTVVLPFGKDGLTLSSTRALTENQVFTIKESDTYFGEKIAQKYGQMVSIAEFPNETSQDYLKYQADRYLFDRRYKDLNLQISFFDNNILSDSENIIIPGDIIYYVTGESSHYGTCKFCKDVKLDFLNPSKSEWKIGVSSTYTSIQYDNNGRSSVLENDDNLNIPLYEDESYEPN